MKNQKGITAIEVLIIIAIIGIIGAISITTLMHARLEMGCQNLFGYPRSAVLNPATKPLVQAEYERKKELLEFDIKMTQIQENTLRTTAVLPEQGQAAILQANALQERAKILFTQRETLMAFAKEIGLTISK